MNKELLFWLFLSVIDALRSDLHATTCSRQIWFDRFRPAKTFKFKLDSRVFILDRSILVCYKSTIAVVVVLKNVLKVDFVIFK